MEDPGYPPQSPPGLLDAMRATMPATGMLGGVASGLLGGLYGLAGAPSFNQRMGGWSDEVSQGRRGGLSLADAMSWANAQAGAVPVELMMGSTSPFVRVWRGSPRAAVDSFGLPPSNSPEPVVWFTSDRGQAEQFARMRNSLRRDWSPDLYMYEAQLPRDQIQSFPWRNFSSDDPLYMPRAMRGLLSAARQDGASIARIPGIQNFENGPLSTSYAVFDPSLVRILGRERFDP